MDARTLVRAGSAGAVVAFAAVTASGGPAAAAGGLVVRPATASGPLLPGGTAISSFTVASTHGVVLDAARVTRVAVRPEPGRQCPPGSVHAVVQDVRRTRIDVRPAVFTVRLRLTPAASAGCAGARLVPQVSVEGTDSAGRRLTGTSAPTPPAPTPPARVGAVVAPVRGEAMLDAPPRTSRRDVDVVLAALAVCAAALALDPTRLVRRRSRGARR